MTNPIHSQVFQQSRATVTTHDMQDEPQCLVSESCALDNHATVNHAPQTLHEDLCSIIPNVQLQETSHCHSSQCASQCIMKPGCHTESSFVCSAHFTTSPFLAWAAFAARNSLVSVCKCLSLLTVYMK